MGVSQNKRTAFYSPEGGSMGPMKNACVYMCVCVCESSVTPTGWGDLSDKCINKTVYDLKIAALCCRR